MAALRLEALSAGTPLWKYIAGAAKTTPGFPHLYMNMLNGGAHANFRLPFQEYIVVVGGRGADGAYAKANQIFDVLGTLVERYYGKVAMGDEGGYSPEIKGVARPFELLQDAAGSESGVFLAIDAAASEFFLDGKYVIDGAPFSRDEMLGEYRKLVGTFHLRSIEDPFDEDDLIGFSSITKELGSGILVVGDDLTVTNPRITKMMIEKNYANAMIIKPNQIGTVSEVFMTARIASEAGWKLIVSHRSGETDDTFIADLAFGLGAYGLKAGAPTQRERRVKYERLVAIEKEFTN
jgi:enolase